MSHTRLVTTEGIDFPALEVTGVPEETVRTTHLLIAKSRARTAPINPALLEIAHQITREHPTYLCANFATGGLIVAGAARYAKAGESLHRAWWIGHRLIHGQGLIRLRYSDCQVNASFLSAGAMLAQYYVWSAELVEALDLSDRVVELDEERATSARFVQAHIHQLMGMSAAVDKLTAIAGKREPMAFYALGLEQLRQQRNKEALISFRHGFMHAPAVAAILLSRDELNKSPSSVSQREASNYGETFCLSEWTASELGLLDKWLTQGELQLTHGKT